MTAFGDLFVDINDFATPALAFAHCTSNPGLTLYLPAGTYDFDGLSFPHKTNLLGVHNQNSIVSGTLTIPNSQGMKFEQVGFTGQTNVTAGRECLFVKCAWTGTTGIRINGPSYYNKWDMCRFECGTAFDIGDPAGGGQGNGNTVMNCRMNNSAYHMKWTNDTSGRGWTVMNNYFEGASGDAGAGVIDVKAIDHVFIGNWMERVGSNVWSPVAVTFGAGTENCVWLGGRNGYLFDIVDNGTNNFIHNKPSSISMQRCNPADITILRTNPS